MIRQSIAQLIFDLSIKIRGIAYFIFPESSISSLDWGYDGEKIRIVFRRHYLKGGTENVGLSVSDWYRITIHMNNFLDNMDKKNV